MVLFVGLAEDVPFVVPFVVTDEAGLGGEMKKRRASSRISSVTARATPWFVR